jgi:hypothetical protein
MNLGNIIVRVLIAGIIIIFLLIPAISMLLKALPSYIEINSHRELQTWKKTNAQTRAVINLDEQYIYTGTLLFAEHYAIDLTGAVDRDLAYVYYPVITKGEASAFTNWLKTREGHYPITLMIASRSERDLSEINYLLGLPTVQEHHASPDTTPLDFIPHSRVFSHDPAPTNLLGERPYLMERSIKGIARSGVDFLPTEVTEQLNRYPLSIPDDVVVIFTEQYPGSLSSPLLLLGISLILLFLVGIRLEPNFRLVPIPNQPKMGLQCPVCLESKQLQVEQRSRFLLFIIYRLFPFVKKQYWLGCKRCKSYFPTETTIPPDSLTLDHLDTTEQDSIRFIHQVTNHIIGLSPLLHLTKEQLQSLLIQFFSKYTTTKANLEVVVQNLVIHDQAETLLNPSKTNEHSKQPEDFFLKLPLEKRILLVSLLYKVSVVNNSIDNRLEEHIQHLVTHLGLQVQDHMGIRWMYLEKEEDFYRYLGITPGSNAATIHDALIQADTTLVRDNYLVGNTVMDALHRSKIDLLEHTRQYFSDPSPLTNS